ncbi:MAG: SPOR domain-containing protein [Spirochaetia bacterium]|jgi:cell division protein FtsN|nr:SPOR domain-containing protein [Spirochaetia bacterium]
MEQNKTLLIILSVALFLATILSVGLWFFYPREDVAGSPPDAENAAVLADDPIEWVRRNEIPALAPQPETPKEDLIIVYGEKPEQGDKTDPPPAAPYPSAPVAPRPPAPKKEQVSPVPRPQVKAPPAVSAPAPARTRSVRVTEFSIQVGAFSSRDRAEELNEVLKEKGLAGQVFYAEGPRLYRLRIGPYTNRGEAEKFLGWVRGINGFESSMIFERNATRTIAN